MSEAMTACAAARLISHGTVKTVYFAFFAIGGSCGLLRVSKVEAKRMLRGLYPSSTVRVDVQSPIVYITGERPAVEYLERIKAGSTP